MGASMNGSTIFSRLAGTGGGGVSLWPGSRRSCGPLSDQSVLRAALGAARPANRQRCRQADGRQAAAGPGGAPGLDLGPDRSAAGPAAARVAGRTPPARHRHRKTLTFVAALRRDGIHAPWVLDKPINARSFRAWVQTCLVLILHPGDIVVMDNLSSHTAAVIRKAIRAVGAKLFYLPPYSPDLNPIEQVFAKLKTLLRKLNARTVEAVIQAIGQLLDEFTAEECAHYLANAGYGSA